MGIYDFTRYQHNLKENFLYYLVSKLGLYFLNYYDLGISLF